MPDGTTGREEGAPRAAAGIGNASLPRKTRATWARPADAYRLFTETVANRK